MKRLITAVALISVAGLAGCSTISNALPEGFWFGTKAPTSSVQVSEKNIRKLANYSALDSEEADSDLLMGMTAAQKAKVTWDIGEKSYRELGRNMVSALETSADLEVTTWGTGMSGPRGKIVPKQSFSMLPVPCRTLDVIIDAKGSRFGTEVGACKKSDVWKISGGD